MTVKILKISDENKLENYGNLENTYIIPRKGEIINILNNRFMVSQVEWIILNKEIYVYIEDMKEKI